MSDIAGSRKGRSLEIRHLAAVSAMTVVIALPAAAQDVSELVTYRPENRAGTAAAAAVIAEMIAERSQSAVVRDRARSMSPQGAFNVGTEELLIDIGAYAFVDPAGGAVMPVALPEPAAGVAAAASVPADASRPAATNRQDWAVGSGQGSRVRDRGGDNDSGGFGGGNESATTAGTSDGGGDTGSGDSAGGSGGDDSGGGGGDSGGGGGDSGGGGGDSGGGGGDSGGGGGGDSGGGGGGDSGGGGGGWN
jgi:hypothetical protein